MSRRAWHCPPLNNSSIGIEHTAMPGEALTPQQEKATIALVGWLLKTFSLGYGAITAHQWAPYATQCPHSLFSKDKGVQGFVDWRRKHFAPHFNMGRYEAVKARTPFKSYGLLNALVFKDEPGHDCCGQEMTEEQA